MFYIQTILIPFVIVLMFLLADRNKNSFRDYIFALFRCLPFIYLYTGVLYYFQINHYAPTGLAFMAVMFFLIPITVILVVIRLIFWFRHSR
jgi:hypothetical protein